MDAAVRYSPHSTPAQQRYLILKPAQHDLRFYQVEKLKGRTVKSRQLAQHSELANVRAFDWSPTEEAIVAVGLSSGEAALLRIDDSSNGVLSFNFKNPRPCNAIALSTKGYLAAGLDKVRNDFCLNIWDINHRLSSWDRKAPGWTSTKPQYEPMHKLASSETISSVKFFTDSPDTLVTGVKGQFVRIYDLRDSSGNPTLQFHTRCAHYLSIDAQDENYFASASNFGEPTVCIWDRRAGSSSSAAAMSSGGSPPAYQLGPVLEYRDCFASPGPSSQHSIWSVRFCRSKRGVFGVLSNQGQIKVYEMAIEYVSESRGNARRTVNSKEPQRLFTKLCRDVQHPHRHRHHSIDTDRIESFDFMVSGHPDDEYRIIACRGNGSVETLKLNSQRPIMEESAKAELTLGGMDKNWAHDESIDPSAFIAIRPTTRLEVPVAQNLISTRKMIAALCSAHKPDDPSASNTARRERRETVSKADKGVRILGKGCPPGFRLGIVDVLALRTVEKRRAAEGYLFNSATNIKILADDPKLQDLWRWVGGAEDAATNEGMVHERLDLAFLGVHRIWKAYLGPRPSSRICRSAEKLVTTEEFVVATLAINHKHKRPSFSGVTTDYPELRELCLAICGLAKSPEEVEAELHRIQTHESRTKAAAWAMFHGYPKKAIEVVLKGNDADKLVAMALAGFHNMAGLTREDNTGAWSDLCKSISTNAKDPWSRAILALVSTGDWKSVIEQTSLPLRDRIGVALKQLGDEELTCFVDSLTKKCVNEGDVEGIWLTGITEETADLFQNYISRSGDVQTAVLVMSYGIPLYFDDYRFKHWRETYCNRLDMYKLHFERCLYTQQHTRKSQTRDGQILIRPPPRQITVRCNHCDKSTAYEQVEIAAEASQSTTSGVHPGNPLNSPGIDSAARCPNCGRHLPRCGVCMMWLGAPDPSRVTGPGAADDKDPVARFLNFCNICHHGFHAHHARDWFAKHKMCPVPECNCLCAAYKPS